VRHKELRDLIAASEFQHRFGDVAAAEDARFDLETPRESKVSFYRLSLLGW